MSPTLRDRDDYSPPTEPELGIEPRHPPYKGGTLPLCYSGLTKFILCVILVQETKKERSPEMAQLRRPSDKTQRIILREAEKAGWLIRNTRSGWQCLSPDGKA